MRERRGLARPTPLLGPADADLRLSGGGLYCDRALRACGEKRRAHFFRSCSRWKRRPGPSVIELRRTHRAWRERTSTALPSGSVSERKPRRRPRSALARTHARTRKRRPKAREMPRRPARPRKLARAEPAMPARDRAACQDGGDLAVDPSSDRRSTNVSHSCRGSTCGSAGFATRRVTILRTAREVLAAPTTRSGRCSEVFRTASTRGPPARRSTSPTTPTEPAWRSK